MRAGLLRDRFTFTRRADGRNAAGDVIPAWNITVASRRGHISPLQGSERFVADQLEAEVDYVITIRDDSGTEALKPKDRAELGSRIFDIQSVLRDQGEVRILVKEVL